MAYRILYGVAKQNRTLQSKWRLLLLFIFFFALFVLSAWQIIPAELMTLRQILFSHEHVDTLLQELKNGESIADAVAAFCQEIINGT